MMKKLIAKIEEKQFTTREFCLLGILLFLLGLLIGIIFSPKGDTTISNNGFQNGDNRQNAGADRMTVENGVVEENNDAEE